MHEVCVFNIDIAITEHEMQFRTFLEERSNLGSGFAYFRGAFSAVKKRKFQVLELIGEEVPR